MPRYFFNYRDTAYHLDNVGVVLDDDASAWTEGTRHLLQTLSSSVGVFTPGAPYRVEISNEEGEVLFSLQLLTADYRKDKRAPGYPSPH